MRKGEVEMIGGDEYDALTGWRRYVAWRAGERAAIKRRYRRRERRSAKERIREWLEGKRDA